jgi:hypothetical protein
MLNTVKDYISNLSNETFDEYYTSYIMYIQDRNIDHELRYLQNKNALNLRSMDQLIYHTMEGMNILGSSNKITELI